MNRFLPIAPVIGLILMLFSGVYLLPLATAFIYQDGTALLFFEGMVTCLLSGALIWHTTRRFQRELKPADGYLLVVLAWGALAAIATHPLMRAIEGLSFTDAYFETMSGLSTTGATVLSGIDRLPQAINLWRHLLNWLGGMGIIMLAVAILPLLGIGGRQLFRAETPGPMKDAKLTPRIAETAKNLWYVYVGLTAACIIALRLAGTTWFDAICHAFAALSLGGFSTHDASVGFFDSPAASILSPHFLRSLLASTTLAQGSTRLDRQATLPASLTSRHGCVSPPCCSAGSSFTRCSSSLPECFGAARDHPKTTIPAKIPDPRVAGLTLLLAMHECAALFLEVEL